MRATLTLAVVIAAAFAASVANGVTPGKNGPIYFDNFDTSSQTSDLYSIGAGGSGLRNLTNTNGSDEIQPAASPNGRQIAYVSNGGGETYHLFVALRTGGGAHALAGGGAAQAQPTWSPNGKLIAYSRCVTIDADGGVCTNAQIAVIGTNGRGVKALSKAASPAVVDSNPAWAPNGRSLAFQRTTSAGVVSLWTVNTTGKSQRRIVNDGSGIDLNPSYTPNGKQIVYSSDSGGHEALWTVQPNGRKRTKLLSETPDPNDSTTGAGTENPAVSPNGRQIVYSSGGDLWTAGIDGKGAKRLTTNGGDDADWARG